MSLVLLAMPGEKDRAERLAPRLAAEVREVEVHPFPDGEHRITLPGKLSKDRVAILSTLSDPDPKVVPLWLAAQGARAAGASSVGLVSPYMPYLRQDEEFHEGEVVSARAFPQLLSAAFDWVVTVDPHLHRIRSLSEVFSIPTKVVTAAPPVATWIRKAVSNPVLIGPDAESEQWVSVAAKKVGSPFVILEKTRLGDDKVEIQVPDLDRWESYTPVLVDDIISTAKTMSSVVKQLVKAGLQAPICVGVHGLFVGNALKTLEKAGAAKVVTCDTIPHPTNAIRLDAELAQAITALSGR